MCSLPQTILVYYLEKHFLEGFLFRTSWVKERGAKDEHKKRGATQGIETLGGVSPPSKQPQQGSGGVESLQFSLTATFFQAFNQGEILTNQRFSCIFVGVVKGLSLQKPSTTAHQML